ncbi:MAG: ABC transporter ATP-binding protein [Deltaproteobacteria bacterium]|nr:ABC transporter ATP-binding protein [Deltaproteobacteria bacterium]
MPETVLTTEDLNKTFRLGLKRRVVEAVRGLSLTVEKGEIYGFLGPNGAGKSTTIKMLMGLIFPTSGTARIFGQPIPSKDAMRSLGYLPENPSFHEFFTPEELLWFFGRLCQMPSGVIADRIPMLLDLVGLQTFAKVPLRRFSKGMVQRAGIAQALINDPALVVLDEPMSGLDPIGRKDVRDIIFRLREQGKTVFFSTHILPDVEAICDRVGLMLKGELRAQGKLESLLTAHTRAVDVIAERVPVQLAELLKARASRTVPKGDGFAFTFLEEGHADEAVATLAGAGARLAQVTRHRETLEDLFVRMAKEAGQSGVGGKVA